MRPVVRGLRPLDDDGNPVEFTEYGKARGPLTTRLGEYCSYCERWIPTFLAVEHVRPKSPNPDLALEWDNFLLACVNCNSCKGTADIDLEEFYWPDRDNTFRAFAYEDGVIGIADGLNDESRRLAQSTLDLLGLQKRPGNDQKASDRRWRHRLEAWNKAKYFHELYLSNPSDKMRTTVQLVATERGFWSIWMTVFADEPEVCRVLVSSSPGTCESCFDSELKPVKRKGGLI